MTNTRMLIPAPEFKELTESQKYGLYAAAIHLLTLSETPRLSPPTEEEIAAYRNLFRAELNKNMNNSSASPSTDAHRGSAAQVCGGP